MSHQTESAELPAALQKLADHTEIRELLARYCRGIDRMDRDLISSVYHPDASDDHTSSYRGSATGFLDWVMVRLRDFTWTMHNLGTCNIDVMGHTAYGDTYAICYHGIPVEGDKERLLTVGVRYVDRLERRHNGPWLIADRVVVIEWRRDEFIDPIRVKRPNELFGQRDKTDHSYKRL